MQDKTNLPSRIQDAVLFVQRRNCPKFIGFLSEQETSLALSNLKYVTDVSYRLWAGYEEGERAVLGIFPPNMEIDTAVFPIVAVCFNYREQDKLSHRDFLGALMSLGIERDTVGDIAVDTGKTIVFLHKNIADYCLSQIQKIGSVGVSVNITDANNLSLTKRFEEKSATIASTRLDNIVGAICNLSRSKALQLIEDGFVAIDGIITTKSTKQIPSNCKLSVRGYGKFVVTAVDQITRKGRIILEYKKYI